MGVIGLLMTECKYQKNKLTVSNYRYAKVWAYLNHYNGKESVVSKYKCEHGPHWPHLNDAYILEV